MRKNVKFCLISKINSNITPSKHLYIGIKHNCKNTQAIWSSTMYVVLIVIKTTKLYLHYTINHHSQYSSIMYLKKIYIAQSICQLQFKSETPIHCFRNQRILHGVVCNIQTSNQKSQCFPSKSYLNTCK